MTDFFISYSSNDSGWAQWIAWQLEEAGYTTIIMDWDFPPGSNFIQMMDYATIEAARVMPIFSEAYFASEYAKKEWPPFEQRETKSRENLIIPVVVQPCEAKGLLGPKKRINLVGLNNERDAIDRLLQTVNELPRLKPDLSPDYRPCFGTRQNKPSQPSFPRLITSEEHPLQPIDYSHLTFLRVLEGADDELFSIAFSPDGHWLAAGSNGKVLLWDVATPILREPEIIAIVASNNLSEDHGKYIYSVSFRHDSQQLVTGCEDGFVRVWDLDKKKFVWEKRLHTEAVYSVAFSPLDGKWVASGGYDDKVLVTEAENGKKRYTSESDFKSKIGRITSIAFSGDGKTLAVGSLDDYVRLWEFEKNTALKLGKHNSSVECVAFSRNGLVASCGLDKAVRVWNPSKSNGYLKWVGKKHDYLVRSVSFSPDGQTLASVGWDKVLNLWHVDNGNKFWAMPLNDDTPGHWHSDWVWSVAFAPDGKIMASSGSDGQIILWKVPESDGKL